MVNVKFASIERGEPALGRKERGSAFCGDTVNSLAPGKLQKVLIPRTGDKGNKYVQQEIFSRCLESSVVMETI